MDKAFQFLKNNVVENFISRKLKYTQQTFGHLAVLATEVPVLQWPMKSLLSTALHAAQTLSVKYEMYVAYLGFRSHLVNTVWRTDK